MLPDAKTPHCGACNHAISFHRNGVTRCYVSGCSCPSWDGPTMVEIKTLSITEAAEVTGRSTDWLRKHWQEVGGRRVEADLLGRTGPTELRFKLPQLNRGIARYERKSAANWHKGAKKAWRTKRAKARQTRKGK